MTGFPIPSNLYFWGVNKRIGTRKTPFDSWFTKDGFFAQYTLRIEMESYAYDGALSNNYCLRVFGPFRTSR